jgi:hypothetical protein
VNDWRDDGRGRLLSVIEVYASNKLGSVDKVEIYIAYMTVSRDGRGYSRILSERSSGRDSTEVCLVTPSRWGSQRKTYSLTWTLA